MRSVLPASRAPANVLPFPPDIHNFTPKIDDVMRAFYGLPYGIPTAAVDPNPFYNLVGINRIYFYKFAPVKFFFVVVQYTVKVCLKKVDLPLNFKLRLD